MARIRILPEIVTNQIAAGEVVQRPASIVKELIENALDAGAHSITLSLVRGGISGISIRDDGCGMDEEDTLLAFERHATSKLATADDLLSIKSFGFRGEALPSIASVSRVELVSAVEDGNGHSIIIEGGRIIKVSPIGAPRGTELRITRLFFNTPARRKFLKSTFTEYQHCLDIMTRVACIHHDLHFRLLHDERVVMTLHPVADMRERIGQIFGNDYASSIMPFHAESENMTIDGFLGNVYLARADRSQQYFFVNHRPVQNRTISYAVSAAAKNVMPKGKYPVIFVSVRIDPTQVDVNVHPAKTEVKFRVESDIYDMLIDSLRRLMTHYVPKAPPRPAEVARERDKQHRELRERQMKAADEAVSENVDTSSEMAGGTPPQQTVTPRSSGTAIVESVSSTVPAADETRIPVGLSADGPDSSVGGPSPISKPSREMPQAKKAVGIRQSSSGPGQGILDWEDSSLYFHSLRYVGQVLNSFLVFERENEMVILDQHAAHERILFEEIFERLTKRSVPVQHLLLPETMDFSPAEFHHIESQRETMQSMGFELEPFGSSTMIIRSVPTWLGHRDPRPILLELLDDLKQSGRSQSTRRGESYEELARLLACKAAVKVHRALEEREVQALITRLAAAKVPFSCPHGRPIIVTVTFRDFEKMFKR